MNNEGQNGADDAPIAILRDQEYEPSDQFLGRVRRSIHRRTTVTQVASFGWDLPKVVLLEMAEMLSGFVSAFSGKDTRR